MWRDRRLGLADPWRPGRAARSFSTFWAEESEVVGPHSGRAPREPGPRMRKGEALGSGAQCGWAVVRVRQEHRDFCPALMWEEGRLGCQVLGWGRSSPRAEEGVWGEESRAGRAGEGSGDPEDRSRVKGGHCKPCTMHAGKMSVRLGEMSPWRRAWRRGVCSLLYPSVSRCPWRVQEHNTLPSGCMSE